MSGFRRRAGVGARRVDQRQHRQREAPGEGDRPLSQPVAGGTGALAIGVAVHRHDDQAAPLEGRQAGAHHRVGAAQLRPRRAEPRRPVDAAGAEGEASLLHSPHALSSNVVRPKTPPKRRGASGASRRPRAASTCGRSRHQVTVHPADRWQLRLPCFARGTVSLPLSKVSRRSDWRSWSRWGLASAEVQLTDRASARCQPGYSQEMRWAPAAAGVVQSMTTLVGAVAGRLRSTVIWKPAGEDLQAYRRPRRPAGAGLTCRHPGHRWRWPGNRRELAEVVTAARRSLRPGMLSLRSMTRKSGKLPVRGLKVRRYRSRGNGSPWYLRSWTRSPG